MASPMTLSNNQYRNFEKIAQSRLEKIDAAQPLPKKINDITREELVEIVDRIRSADENDNFFLELLERNVPHPRVSNLIYWPTREGLTKDPTSEEIVNKAMDYRPIQL
jgi:hypothetical protein